MKFFDRSSHLTIALIAISGIHLNGCQEQIDTESLGTIVYDVPKFDPIDQKYPLPKLKEPPPGEDSHAGHDHSHDGHDHAHP